MKRTSFLAAFLWLSCVELKSKAVREIRVYRSVGRP
jgi:hypothetical protein